MTSPEQFSSDLNSVRFAIENDPRVGLVMNLYVDGSLLQEWLRAVERDLVLQHDLPVDRAGEYAGIANLDAVRWPSKHFLGEPAFSWYDNGDTVLLGCICGDVMDRPLLARIDMSDGLVSWRDFALGGHADWDLSAIGPYRFAKNQYLTALEATAA